MAALHYNRFNIICKNIAFLFLCIAFSFNSLAQELSQWINTNGTHIATRFNVPLSYRRVSTKPGSFAYFLQNLPLKPHGTPVFLHNGLPKEGNYHAAVLTFDTGKKDLQQCADAVIRLRAEYLWATSQPEKIAFHLTNGFLTPYAKWQEGWRVNVNGNQTIWVKSAQKDTTYQTFRKYLDFVYTYAGSISLAKELSPVELGNAAIGDVFIQGGSPGHAVLIVDIAIHELTGEKICLVAQSYMPAQDIHILQNLEDSYLSPWIKLPENSPMSPFITPQWRFIRKDLKRF